MLYIDTRKKSHKKGQEDCTLQQQSNMKNRQKEGC